MSTLARIAIIGGIGSGKSEVLRVAKDMGLHTLSADGINAELMNDSEYIERIAAEFPSAVKAGRIDKRALADIVFSDSVALERLNAIAHPRILKRIEDETISPLVVEMPLLVEIGAKRLFDEVVLVHTPFFKRLSRLKSRGMSAHDAIRRMHAQASEKYRKAAATQVIDNSKDMDTLVTNARKVFEDILK